ncbi:MAG: hypothetical protein GY711_17275 [bacterium]|nr:hypothetical protein [bacterium]
MRYRSRKTTPKVRAGKIQRKNRPDLSPDIFPWIPGNPTIRRERPGAGHRHLLRVQDVERFLSLLPDWDELSSGLRGVLIAEAEEGTMGWHVPGTVSVCAWEREIEGYWTTGFVDDHRDVLERLGVPCEQTHQGDYHVRWTETSARGFQLMHILLHELGHHHDRMTTRSQEDSSRGEDYAEQYALRYAERLWERYFEVFGW